VTAASRLYSSPAVGGPEQPTISIRWSRSRRPETSPALAETQAIEATLGRERTVRWAEDPGYRYPLVPWLSRLPIGDLQVPHRAWSNAVRPGALGRSGALFVLPAARRVSEALVLVGEQVVSFSHGSRTALVVEELRSDMDFSVFRPRYANLPREKQAVILAHNYQRPEVQDVADILGDSLWLSQQAAAPPRDDRVLRGYFMAETPPSWLRPSRHPTEPRAGCPWPI